MKDRDGMADNKTSQGTPDPLSLSENPVLTLQSMNLPYEWTVEFIFDYDINDLYPQDKARLQQLLSLYRLPDFVISFDDANKSMRFKYFSLQEIVYIFDIGLTPEMRAAIPAAYPFPYSTRINKIYSHYLNECNARTTALSKQHHETFSEPEGAPGYISCVNFPDIFTSENIKHLVIAENHYSTASKLALIRSMPGLIATNSIILLEHLCHEAMQPFLDCSSLRGELHPLLSKYLHALDCHQFQSRSKRNIENGFHQLVNMLVTNHIPVVALDTQYSYSIESTSRFDNDVPLARLRAHSEWKRIFDMTATAHPDSRLVALCGSGHTAEKMTDAGCLNEITSFTGMVGGLRWMPDGRCLSFRCIEQPAYIPHVQEFRARQVFRFHLNDPHYQHRNDIGADFLKLSHMDYVIFPGNTSELYKIIINVNGSFSKFEFKQDSDGLHLMTGINQRVATREELVAVCTEIANKQLLLTDNESSLFHSHTEFINEARAMAEPIEKNIEEIKKDL